MFPPPPRSPRTYTLFPYTTPFRADRGRGPPSAPPPASRRALRARILASIGELAVKASAFDAVLALYQHRPSPPPNPGEARPRSARVDDGGRRLGGGQDAPIVVLAIQLAAHHRGRSEEHTSELQSLMRIAYAVFCLKKKKT